MKVVSNATPIISLSTIGRISLLHQLFGKIYIPREVYNELKSKKAPGYQEIDAPYFQVREIQGTQYIGFLLHDLDRGEAEAILLAKEIQADTLIIDERIGYAIAESTGTSCYRNLDGTVDGKRARIDFHGQAVTV